MISNWYPWLMSILVIYISIYSISLSISNLKKTQKRVDKFKYIFSIGITVITLPLMLYLFYQFRTLTP